jgi:hypothetical protein
VHDRTDERNILMPITKLRTAIAAAALAGGLGAGAAGYAMTAPSGSPQPRDPSVAGITLTGAPGDISGRCDEPEHANDPQCVGVSPTSTSTTPTTAQPDPASPPAAQPRREAGEDVRGPCDEAEHANDPRCTGVSPSTTVRDDDDDAAEDAADDVSGPCDEPEHANEPRCTGSPSTTVRDDRSGRGGDRPRDDSPSTPSDDSRGRGRGSDD